MQGGAWTCRSRGRCFDGVVHKDILIKEYVSYLSVGISANRRVGKISA
jgi:hypothetical protein